MDMAMVPQESVLIICKPPMAIMRRAAPIHTFGSRRGGITIACGEAVTGGGTERMVL